MSSIIDKPADQIEYTPSIDLTGVPVVHKEPISWSGRLITWFIKYPSNIIGVLPVFGSVIGLTRILFAALYKAYANLNFSYDAYKIGFFKAKRILNENLEFADLHHERGVNEMIPFWNTAYLLYYDFVLCQVSSVHNFY